MYTFLQYVCYIFAIFLPSNPAALQSLPIHQLADCNPPILQGAWLRLPGHRAPQAASSSPCWPMEPSPLALKLVLPPAWENQITHLGTLAAAAEPKWQQSLAADRTGDPRSPKWTSNAPQINRHANKKTSIQACIPQAPEVDGRGGSL